MFNVFNSGKRMVFHSKKDPQVLLEEFNSRIEEETVLMGFGAHPASGTYVGTVSGHDVTVRYLGGEKNSLKPTLHVHVESSPSGGSVLTTQYSTALGAQIFMGLWMGMAISAAATALSTPHPQLIPVMFPAFGLLVMVLMRHSAKGDEEKLESLVRTVADCFDGRVISK